MAALNWLEAAVPAGATIASEFTGIGESTVFQAVGCGSSRSAAVISPVDSDESGLSECERSYIKMAVASRRREFATGRRLAKWCLNRIGHPWTSISRHSDRSPVWPAGIVGSISHCRHLAVVTASSRWFGVGVDVECLNHPTLIDMAGLFTAAEQRSVCRPYGTTILFSAKEAVYKAVYPHTQIQMDFLDVEIDVRLSDHQFAARYVGPPGENQIVEQIRGLVAVCDSHVFTLAVIDR